MRRAHEGYLQLPYCRRFCTSLFWCWCIKDDGCCHRFFVDPKYYAAPNLEDEMEGGELLVMRGLPLAGSKKVAGAGSAYLYAEEDDWYDGEEEGEVEDEEGDDGLADVGESKDGNGSAGGQGGGEMELKGARKKKTTKSERKKNNNKKKKKRRATEHYHTANTCKCGV